MWTTLVVSVSLSILILCYALKSAKPTKFRHWLSQNYPKIILSYLILTVIFISIQSEIIWSFDTLKDAVTLEWTMFGISIAIFLVWNGVILPYLENMKPLKSDKMGFIHKWDYIGKKEDFYPEASAMFNSVTLLIINTFVLAFATVSVFIVKEKVTLFSQNTVIISFYFCTNTLVRLFLDILKPLHEKKKKILQEAKVTANDIKEKNEIEQQILNSYRLINDIEKLESIDKEQKAKMKSEIIAKIFEPQAILETENNSKDSLGDDQL